MGRIRRVDGARAWRAIRGLLEEGRGDAALLLGYFLIGPSFTFIGAAELSIAGTAEALVISPRRIRAALQVLAEQGHIRYDEAHRVVFIPLILEADPVRGSGQVAGALRRLEELPLCPLVDEIREKVSQGLLPGESPILSPRVPEETAGTPRASLSNTVNRHRQPSPSKNTPSPSVGNGETDDFSPRGTGHGAVPRTPEERFVEDELIPVLGESHRREEFLRVVCIPGGLAYGRAALERVRGARGVRNPGALWWSTYKELQASGRV